jgi:CheY-like chemotaxis protein
MTYTVLVVEDNPLNMELARDLLEDRGYEVLEAVDWRECMVALTSHMPDLVLMDVQLPDKDGLQITRDLRGDPRYADLVIVAMTAHAMPEDESRVLEAGCDGYLTKPIDTRTLPTDVERYLALGSTRHAGGRRARVT